MNRHDTHFVRFDRRSTQPLHALPSHEDSRRGPVHAPLLPPVHRAARRWLTYGAFAVVALVALAVIVAASGLFAVPAQRMASETLQRMVPSAFDLQLGDTDVRLAWPPSLAVTYTDVALTPSGGSQAVADVGRLSVRIDPWSLVAAAPRLSGVRLHGLRLDVPGLQAALPAPSESEPMAFSVVPERFEALFAGLRQWGAIHLHRPGVLRLRIRDAEIALADIPLGSTVSVQSLDGRADGNGQAGFSGTLAFGDDVSPVSGTLQVPATETDGPVRIDAQLDAMPFPWRRLPTLFSGVRADHEPGAQHLPVPTQTRIELVYDAADVRGHRLRVSLEPRGLSLKLAAGDFVPASGILAFDYDFESRNVDLVPASWTLGRSEFELSGGVRDLPASVEGGKPGTLEFEFLANEGRLAPEDSPERPLPFAARARGSFSAAERLIAFTDLEVQTNAGAANGEGQISLDPTAPIAVFDITVSDMAVAALKQLWPAPVARAARRWVLENLAGGRVVAGTFDIAEPLRRRDPETGERILGDTAIALDLEGARFDLTGDLPPVRDAVGRFSFADETARVTLQSGTIYLPSGRTADASDGTMVITPPGADGFVMADVDVRVRGSADALGEVVAYYPISAMQFYAYDPADLSGEVDARIDVRFALAPRDGAPPPDWTVAMTLEDAASAMPIEGRALTGLTGSATVTPRGAELDVAGTLDGIPADLAMTIPFGDSDLEPARAITLRLDDASRRDLAPGLEALLRGPTPVKVGDGGEALAIEADLTAAELLLPWIGWSKGAGIEARAAFALLTDEDTTVLDDFRLTGSPFGASGRIEVGEDGLKRARFDRLQLNEGDDVAVDVRRDGAGYAISVEGDALDVRALIRQVRTQLRQSGGGDAVPIRLSAAIGTVRGFRGATMRDVRLEMTIDSAGLQALSITGTGAGGFPFSVALQGQGAGRRVRVEAFDAGEFLRFADLYGQIAGGVLTVDLTGAEGGILTGPVRLTDFRVFDEPRLAQLVSSGAGGGDSLNQVVRRDIDTREVPFELAQGQVTLSPGALDLSAGIARGPLVGFALQGRVFDADNRMRLTGTFMPAYGVNSLFGDIPLVGLLLGNGRERGLIGVTFKLEGAFEQPQVTVNPLSIIAPGVFRGIFEFR